MTTGAEPPVLHASRLSLASLADAARQDPGRLPGSVPLHLADGNAPPAMLETCAACRWNERALYVSLAGRLLHPPAPIGRAFAERRTPYLWDAAEVMEIFVGEEARTRKHYREFEVAPDGRWISLQVACEHDQVCFDQSWVGGFQAVSLLDQARARWTVVMEIPWSDLTEGDPRKTTWEANFYRSAPAMHGAILLAWSPTGYGDRCFHRPERFGRILLDD